MEALPSSRVVEAAAFTHTGMSFTGPLSRLKESYFRMTIGDGPTWAQFYSHSGPLFIYWSLSSLFYYWSLTSLSY
ncbi:hypothetical protein T12_15726 [Trichinella patagoniensis]|uniref:Uncharacterized protein n=1 Tax=Trichinella patagoniensis TaxID=990121 RepID=A0A0V0Z6P8_9BILA|nr:hypothetical protein T12_15726 [Trichinella patagoniensis]